MSTQAMVKNSKSITITHVRQNGLCTFCDAPAGEQTKGETKCDLKTRLNNHRYTIRKQRLDLPVLKHCTEMRHNEWELKCMVIDSVPPSRGVVTD